MAQITIDIQNVDVTRVIDGIAGFFQYQAVIVPIIGEPFPNPESKNMFVRRMIKESMKSWVTSYESSTAAESARQTAKANAEQIPISVT